MDLGLPFYVISDTHWFDQESIDVYGRSSDYNERLVENWNSVVGTDDLILHLGDVVISDFEEFEKIAPKLNGRKLLIKGNRDQQSELWYESLGFSLIHPFELRYGDYRVSFSHRPHLLMNWNEINLFGHVHSASLSGLTERHVNCCVEVRDYTPQPVEKLISFAVRRMSNV